MGCFQSTPADNKRASMSVGKTERQSHSAITAGQSTRVPQTSTSSVGGGTMSLEVEEDNTDEMPELNENGQMTTREVVRRTSSSLHVTNISLGNIDKGGKVIGVEYAYRSQRGYYPDDPKKANQDKYGITLDFAGENGDAVFAVYDGHGSEGHDCASFSKKKLPQILAKHLRQKRVQRYMAKLKSEGKTTKGAWNPKQWPLLPVEEYEQCCRKAFLETNRALHDEKTVEDKLSGTTAVTASFHGGRMTVCNVGDSRVVVGHRVTKDSAGASEETKEEEKCEIEPVDSTSDDRPKTGDLLAIPLSRDQTPYRKDERDRVRKEGAEIKSIDQMEGREDGHDNWGDMVLGERVDIHGDPPRVWVKDGDYPGTAFTRSLGDRIAEDIGVNAEPEIVTKELTVNDEYLVIASDGIFEFLTNQDVINMCAASFNPLQACEIITKAAYDKWLEYENRTDDITIIVCFLKSTYKPASDELEDTTESLVATAGDVYGTKPIRSMLKPDPSKISSEKPLPLQERPTESGNIVN